MQRLKRLEVLFALLGTSNDAPVDGEALTRRLAGGGVPTAPDVLLTALLRLERSGHVAVHRSPAHTFSITPLGEDAAHDLGPGGRVDTTVVMIDLVGFVAFTEVHGDEAARHAAMVLHDAADDELRSRAGRVVKALGDGILGMLPPGTAVLPAIAAIAQRCHRPDGSRWELRAAAREGRPIAHGGDLYGADVNLVSRLCSAARPNELVVALALGSAEDERVAVRGLTDAVPIQRVVVS